MFLTPAMHIYLHLRIFRYCRLSRFASQQLTEGNPNIADLSDIHRPTRLGEMYSQLFDDEWSEAFEALKPNMKKGEEEDDEDELYPNILTLLHSILEASLCTLTLRCREYDAIHKARFNSYVL